MAGRRRAASMRSLAAALFLFVPFAQAAAEPPARVMSLNVCTDQLAMLLAEPGQLVSVSDLAADPALSFHHRLADGLPKNKGLAEEVLVARPDLVLTGTYSLHNTTALLKHLGFRVVEFDYAQTLDTIPGEIRRMADSLGRPGAGEALAADFEAGLRAAGEGQCGPAPTAIAYGQNGVSSGSGTLLDSAMRAAGLRNLAAESGYAGMTPFPLELLVRLRPQIVIVGDAIANTPALADLAAAHPALRALGDETLRIALPPASASCGGPFVLEAVKALADARRAVVRCDGGEG